MSADIHLTEIDGYTDVAAFTTVRLATGPADGYRSLPTDTPPNAWYDACGISVATITRQAFAGGGGGSANGSTELGFGVAEFVNRDGRHDATFGSGAYSFRERPYRVLRVAPGAALSTAVLVQRAVVAQAELSREKLTLHIKDRMYELDTPHIATFYAGNNALPAGVEGASELAGKPKPRLYGAALGIEPVIVNTSKLIYQVNNGAVTGGSVYDGGQASFTAGADYTSQADMEATAPSSGQVRWWKAGGMFRLGNSPTHRITCDATAHSAAGSTVAQLIKTLATERGIAAGDISASDVSALDALNSAVCGIYVADTRTTRQLIDLLAATAGVYVGFDELGVLRMSRFAAASGTPDAVLARWNVAAVETVPSGEDVPVGTVRLQYAHYTAGGMTAGDLSGSLGDAARADLAQEWRTALASATPSPNPFKRLRTIERDTAYTYKADADAEAARLLGLYGTPRRAFRLRDVQLSDAQLSTLAPNSVIELRWPRYGFSTEVGTLLRVIEITKNFTARRAELVCWG